jgi:hypothetical protein
MSVPGRGVRAVSDLEAQRPGCKEVIILLLVSVLRVGTCDIRYTSGSSRQWCGLLRLPSLSSTA